MRALSCACARGGRTSRFARVALPVLAMSLAAERAGAQGRSEGPAGAATVAPGPVPEHRDERTTDSVVIALGGFIYDVGLGAAISGGPYINRETLVEAELATGVAAAPSVRSRTIEIRLKRFLAKTFYLNGGIRYRSLVLDTVDDHGPGVSIENAYDEQLVEKDVGPDLAIGNRWRNTWLTVGFDWVGVYAPVGIIAPKRALLDPRTGRTLAVLPLSVAQARGKTVVDVRLFFLTLGASF